MRKPQRIELRQNKPTHIFLHPFIWITLLALGLLLAGLAIANARHADWILIWPALNALSAYLTILVLLLAGIAAYSQYRLEAQPILVVEPVGVVMPLDRISQWYKFGPQPSVTEEPFLSDYQLRPDDEISDRVVRQKGKKEGLPYQNIRIRNLGRSPIIKINLRLKLLYPMIANKPTGMETVVKEMSDFIFVNAVAIGGETTLAVINAIYPAVDIRLDNNAQAENIFGKNCKIRVYQPIPISLPRFMHTPS